MKLIVRLFWILLAGTTLGQETFRLELQPLDIRYDGPVSFGLRSISQIESNGTHLFLRSKRDNEIVVITPEGKPVQVIGGSGAHPGEFDYGVLAMALHGHHLWAVDMGRNRVRRYLDGVYENSFKPVSYNTYIGLPTSNAFAVSDRELVLPASPKTGALATVYRFDGTPIENVGETFPFADELTHRIPGINDTFWLREGRSWYSIHKFVPIVTRYDENFQVTQQFQVHSRIIEEVLDKVYTFHPPRKGSIPIPSITDVKIHDDHIYLMVAGRLHKVDLTSGEVKSITSFYGTGPDFAEVTGSQVALFFFAFLKNGKLVLAHPTMMWHHELWTVDPDPGNKY